MLGGAIKNADVFQGGDGENATNYWANGLSERLVTNGRRQTVAGADTAEG